MMMATSSSFLPHHSLCFKVLRTRLVPRRPVWAGNIDGSDLVSNLALQPIYVINLGGASLVDFAKRDFSEPNCRQRLSYSQHSGHINGPGSSNCAYLPHEMKVANRALEERRMDRHDRAAYVTNINENLADTLVKNETTQIVALQQNIKFNGGGHSKNLDAAPLEPPAAAPAPNTQAQGACDIIPSEGQDDLPVSRQNARSYSSAFAHPIVTQNHSFSSEEKVFADTYSLFPMRSAWKKALSSNLAASASINLRADRFAITTAAVCTPAVFTVEERDDVFHELDADLWANRGPKGLRKLVAMLASSGMGKSAFVDAYGEYLLRKEDAVRVIPVNISFNTTNFGPQCHSSHVISIASRMLLSYCVRDPNPRRLEEVMNILETICGDHHERSIFLVVDWIITDFKEQTGQDARIFVGIDELGKGSLTNGSRNAEEVLIQAVTGALDDGFMEFRISALFTALQIHGLMCETKASQRGIKYVPLRLLSTEASMTLLRSFIPEGEHDEMVNKLARMAVGHPRSIQLIKTAYLEVNNKGVINETSMENIANAAMENIAKDKLLSNDELKFVLIKPMLSTKEALEAGIADMISRGKIMVTLSDTAVVVGIPPLVIRRSILECTPDAIHITAATKSLLLKLLDVAGWLNVAQFGARNNGTGKPFEEFHMFAEMILRNLLKVPQLHGTATVSDFYPSFSGSMKSDVAKSTDTYPALDAERSLDNVIDLPEVTFPSQPQFDFLRKEHSFPKANRLMGKALCARNVVLKPTFQYQQGFDVLLCGQGAGGKALLEGLEMSFSNNDYWINHPSAFHKRMVKKLKAVAAMRLQMRSIGINIDKDMRQVFAFHAVLPSLVAVGKASAEPREFKSWKDYLHHICVNEVGEEQLLNVVLLDKTDVSRMYRGLDSLAMLLKYTYEDKVPEEPDIDQN